MMSAEDIGEITRQCPAEAEEHFRRGNEHNIKADYLGAMREYIAAMKAGFPLKGVLYQSMVDAGINMRVLGKRDANGKARPRSVDRTGHDELEALAILRDAEQLYSYKKDKR